MSSVELQSCFHSSSNCFCRPSNTKQPSSSRQKSSGIHETWDAMSLMPYRRSICVFIPCLSLSLYHTQALDFINNLQAPKGGLENIHSKFMSTYLPTNTIIIQFN